MTNPVVLATWLLCGLGAAVFATAARQSWRDRVALVCSFMAAVAWKGSGRPLEPAWIGALTAGFAVLILGRPSWPFLSAFGSGVLGGTLCGLLQVQGMPRAVAFVASGSLLVITLFLASWRNDFTPPATRDEALLAVGAFGSLVAAAPAVAAGWQSALLLNLGEKHSANPAIPAWVLGVGGASMGAGMVWVVLRSQFAKRAGIVR